MRDKENWESVFLGKLKEDETMRTNTKNDSIRFYIEIISNIPNSFPSEEEKRIIGFSNEIEKLGFIDDINLDDNSRFLNLENFLNDYYMLFKVVKNKHAEYERYYYNAYDIELQRRENSDKNNYFFPVPFIRTTKNNVEDILKKLSNNEFIKHLSGFSTEEEDCSSFVLIGEMNNVSDESLNFESIHTINKIYAFGPIENLLYSEEYGFKFITSEEKNKVLELDLNSLGEFYISKEKVTFITGGVDNLILKKIDTIGKSIESKKVTKIEDEDEEKFLEIFEEVALSKKLSYDLMDLANFHTAMKTQSFVILAGMSGTGKSQIVQCYHEALNKFAHPSYRVNEDLGSRLLFVPVRPFWQDDSDLLGYLDTLNGIYRPGDAGLVDFILESSKNESECYIVCLDEMNLAKVEHYFSQFLSILERDIKSRELRLYNEKLNGRVYNQNDYPSKLSLGENLFFVGTVNLDESTFQFSDKVLDRANVINLKVNSFKEIRKSLAEKKVSNNESEDNEIQLDESLRTYTKFKGMKKVNVQAGLSDLELDLLWSINLEIREVNERSGVGYRIVNQIESYIMNLPINNVLTRGKAFDLQVTQRILTKLRGSEIQLSSLVGVYGESEYKKEGNLYKLLVENNKVSDFEYSKSKLIHLARELSEYGHTI